MAIVPPPGPASIELEVMIAERFIGTPSSEMEARSFTMVDHWTATGGLSHAVLAVQAMAGRCGASMFLRLAHHVALADEGSYQDALGVAEFDAAPNEHALAGLAFAFPQSGRADALVRIQATRLSRSGVPELHPLAVASVSEAATLDVLRSAGFGYAMRTGGRSWRDGPAEPTLFTLVARFGDAVLPAFDAQFDAPGVNADATRALARAIAFIGTEDAFSLLCARVGDRHVAAVLVDAALRNPRPAMAPLTRASSLAGKVGAACRKILGQLTARASVALEVGQPCIEVSTVAQRTDDLGFLVDPPWLRGAPRRAPAVLVAQMPFVETFVGECVAAERAIELVDSDNASRWGISPELANRIARFDVPEHHARFEEASRAHASRRNFCAVAGWLVTFPPRLIARLVTVHAAAKWHDPHHVFRRLADVHRLALLDAFLAFAASHTEEGLDVLLPYRSPRVAMLAADAQYRLKKKPPAARAWLLRHPEAAAVGLIPKAIGKAGKERDAAEYVLRLLAREGHEGVVMEVAARYGEVANTATRAVLDFDPLQVFPTKLPSLPDFAKAETLPRLVLRASGKALPASAMQHVLTMLAFSKPGEPYAGIAILKELTTTSSQGDFAWELFQSWQVAGADSKQGWAFAAMGFFGDDACARKLTPLLRAWPGEAQHQRAVAGLEVLASIGTDVALMHLHGIAQKLKFKGLQEKAREKIDQIAEARGLTADELADRLVPDLGLDEDGSLTLDFGPRKFRVVFDESLKPFAKEESGKRLPDLPKPRKDDDETKSKEATETWKALKKDSKTIAQQQVTRLELAMCGRRRWTSDVFRPFLVEHPLMRHLVQRIVWGTYSAEGKLTALFRVAEDGSYADARDEAFTLPEGASIGVAHTLEMQKDDEAKFAQSFADYELLQPFKQLGRETFALTPEEAALPSLSRWAGKKIPTGKVLGLEARGWRRAAPINGHVGTIEKPVGMHKLALELDPGMEASCLEVELEQELVALDTGGMSTLLGELDAMGVSEALRDIAQMLAVAIR
jgi:hypothetical protein